MYSVTSLEHFVNSMEFCLEVRVNSILLSAAFRVHGLSLSILIYFASFAFIDITAVFVLGSNMSCIVFVLSANFVVSISWHAFASYDKVTPILS